MTFIAPEWVIDTDGLTKRYGTVTAVENLSLRLPRGGVFGLLGPNGSGKTTTLSMLLGLVRPTSGTIRLFGENAHRTQRQALRRIGAIVDGPAFYPYLTGRENLRAFQTIGRDGGPAELDHVLDLVGLTSRAHSRYHTYSMGMRQRLGIACALLGAPELLFLDEPTNGLDPAGVVEVRNLIRRLGTDGRTVLLCSHLLHEVEQVCDRVAILSRGRLMADGDVRDLLGRRSSVRLRTTDDVRAREVLGGISWVDGVEVCDGRLRVLAPAERSAELSHALFAQGIDVAELVPITLSLEQYFLDVTGAEAAKEEVAR